MSLLKSRPLKCPLPILLLCLLLSVLTLGFLHQSRHGQVWTAQGSSGPWPPFRPMTDFPTIQPHACVNSSRLHGVTATICVKPADKFVSAAVLSAGAWEPLLVTNMLRALSLYPSAALLDVGCNIGMFTLMAAGLGRRVLAVDAVAENLAYVHASLEKDGRTELVTLVHNSVSNEEELSLYPVLHKTQSKNPGATRLLPADSLIYSSLAAIGPPTRSVLLASLLSSVTSSTIVLKLDIEGWECRALLARGVFHTGKFIPYIFMEWEHLVKNAALVYDNSDNCAPLSRLLEVLAGAGYRPLHPATLAGLDNATLHTPILDVLWVHKTARTIGL